jgi:competence protein ComEC
MPLLWLSLAFVSGILLGEWLPWPWTAWLGMGLACLAAWLVLRRFTPAPLTHPLLNRFVHATPGAALPLAALIVALCAGAARYQAAHPPLTPSDIAWYNGRGPLVITGVVDAPPDTGESTTSLRVRVRQIAPVDAGSADSAAPGQPVNAPQPAGGLLLVKLTKGSDWRYGDLVELTGSPNQPQASFSFTYPDYLARQGITSALDYPRAKFLQTGQGNPFSAGMYAFKEKGLHVLVAIFPTPEAELLQGIILGEDNNIPKDLAQAYITTGTAHIIAISGFNIAILANLFSILFTRLLGRRWGALAAFIAIGLYSLLVGAGASVVRAAIMGSLGLLAAQIGRRQAGANSLAFTAALMCLITPDLLWDVSFQLSFTATLGLVLYAQPLEDAFVLLARRFLPGALPLRLGGPVGEYILFTLAAQVTTLPVMIYHFQRVSLVSLLANPLVLPAQPAAMILGGLAALGGMLYLPLGQFLAYLAWPFVAYTNRVVEWLAVIPQRNVDLGQLSLIFVLLLYLILFSATFVQGWRAALRRIVSPQAAVLGTAVLALLIWRAVFSLPDGRLHLVMLPSSPAGSFLVQSPTGRAVLVNGGTDASTLKQAIDVRLPFFARRLDFLVVASTRKDSVLALPTVLDSLPCAGVLWGGPLEASQAAINLDQLLRENAIPITPAAAGQSLELGDGARLTILSTDQTGMLLLLEWRAFRALLPFPQETDKPLASINTLRADPVTVLLLAGHGSLEQNPTARLAAERPQLVLANPIAGDPKSQIAPEVLAALKGYPILTSAERGWIDISTDGEKMWITTER